MLIVPAANQPAREHNKKGGPAIIVHWFLMSVWWIVLFTGGYGMVGIKTGRITLASNATFVSVVFTLSLFMVIYSIGMTLFFIAYSLLNKSKDQKYIFFNRLNSLMIIAFIIVWTFSLLSL
jgi:hypothetical protein